MVKRIFTLAIKPSLSHGDYVLRQQ